ncbi:MAG: GNAT family N-acetyltransferase [Gammaproteobacteria bacterium]|nr:GNAT family N-acetyltransferase [Gammaproteobacteria bacterium]
MFTAQRRCHALARDADIEVNDVGWPYGGRFNKYQDCLEFADWVNMILPLEDQWTDVVRSFRKSTRNNDLRLIRRNQYRFEATNDPESIESFYDTMYLPSARLRHGAASIVAPKKHVLKRARQGKLLQIYKGDQLVIAGVVYPEDDVLYFLWQGSPPDFQERPAEGAASALYYFGIRYAFDNELSAVDFAGTRAFLDFGDFRFKRKWGAFVDDSFSPNSVFLRPLNSRPGTIAFCERFPLIARSDDGLEAVIVSRDKTVDTDTLVHMGKNYDCEGLARFVIVGVSEQTRPSMRVEELDGREYRVIQCRPEQFTSVYVARSLANR